MMKRLVTLQEKLKANDNLHETIDDVTGLTISHSIVTKSKRIVTISNDYFA